MARGPGPATVEMLTETVAVQILRFWCGCENGINEVIDIRKVVVRQICAKFLKFHGSESDFQGVLAGLKRQLLLVWGEAPGSALADVEMLNVGPATVGTYVEC